MRRSIERTLLAWILGALGLGSVLVALVAYVVTLEEMQEVFDANLKAVAETISGYHGAHREAGVRGAARPPAPDAVPGEYDIVMQTWTPEGLRTYASHPRVELPFTRETGLAHVRAGGADWVVYSLATADGVAQAGQSLAARRFMARESAGEVLPPLLVLIAVVAALLVLGLRRGLKPLDAAAADIAARSAASLQAIPGDDAPRELAPLVASINGLMARLDEALSAQRRFLADAAHELRTPLTALRLQHQLLGRVSDEAARRETLAELEQGIDRAQHLVEQLLQVSRAEPDGEALRLQAVDLGALSRDVVAAFAARADRLGIDLGAGPTPPVHVRADPHQLTVLLNNLVDNALRYTPGGGAVDVGVVEHAGRPALVVSDTGPGIPEQERARAFDRFFRGDGARALGREGQGSGLGLAIVKAIADRHGASVALGTPAAGRGLEARVSFACAEAMPGPAGGDDVTGASSGRGGSGVGGQDAAHRRELDALAPEREQDLRGRPD